nr:sulfite exporter TauE/SafE family protein [Ornithinimicrobium sp. F0845]
MVGIVVGTVMGSLGGGGAIVAVPALVYLLDQSPLEATTTSLVVVGVTAVVGAAQYARQGLVNVTDAIAFGALSIVGAVVGARMALVVDGDLLMLLFAALLVVVAWLMWTRAGGQQAEEEVAHHWLQLRPFHLDRRRAVRVALVATGIGWLTGFFGVGGGFAIVPALVLLLGLPLRRAVGTSLLVLAMTSLVGLATRATAAVHLDWPLIIAFTTAAVVASLLAGRFSARLRPERLSRGFAVFLVAVALYTLVNSIAALTG